MKYLIVILGLVLSFFQAEAKASPIHVHLGMGRLGLGLIAPSLLEAQRRENEKFLGARQEPGNISGKDSPAQNRKTGKVLLMNRYSSFFKEVTSKDGPLSCISKQDVPLKVSLSQNGEPPYAQNVSVFRFTNKDGVDLEKEVTHFLKWAYPSPSSRETESDFVAILLFDPDAMGKIGSVLYQFFLGAQSPVRSVSTALGGAGSAPFTELFQSFPLGSSGTKQSEPSGVVPQSSREVGFYFFENDELPQLSSAMKQAFDSHEVKVEVHPAMVDRVCVNRRWIPSDGFSEGSTIERKTHDRKNSCGQDQAALDVITEQYKGKIVMLRGSSGLLRENRDSADLSNVLCDFEPGQGFAEITCKNTEQDFAFAKAVKRSLVNEMQTFLSFKTLLAHDVQETKVQRDFADRVPQIDFSDRLTGIASHLSLDLALSHAKKDEFVQKDTKASLSTDADYENFSNLLIHNLIHQAIAQKISGYEDETGLTRKLKGEARATFERLAGQHAAKDTTGRILNGGVRRRFKKRLLSPYLRYRNDSKSLLRGHANELEVDEPFIEEVIVKSEALIAKAERAFKASSEPYTLNKEGIIRDLLKSKDPAANCNVFRFLNWKLHAAYNVPFLYDYVNPCGIPPNNNLKLKGLEPIQASLEAMESSNMQIETFLRLNDAPWDVIAPLEFLRDEYKDRFLDYESATFSGIKKDDYETYNSLKFGSWASGIDLLSFFKNPAVFDNRLEKQTHFFRGFLNKVKRVKKQLVKIRNAKFNHQSSGKRYLELMGPMPYPHAYLISQGSYSPYHVGHSELARVGRSILCEKFTDACLMRDRQTQEKCQLQCNAEGFGNVFGILSFSKDQDVLLKGDSEDFQHLFIGERIKLVEPLLEEGQALSWMVHDATNVFGRKFLVHPDTIPQNSHEFAMSSEVLDIVFLIAVSPFFEGKIAITSIEGSDGMAIDAREFIRKKYPNIFARYSERIDREALIIPYLDLYWDAHKALDTTEFTSKDTGDLRSCDSRLQCIEQYLEIFEDLSNLQLVDKDSSLSKHFNNRLAAISTNSEKQEVTQERGVYRDGTSRLNRELNNPLLSSTTIRKILKNNGPSAELSEFLEESSSQFLSDLSKFFEAAEKDPKVVKAYLWFKQKRDEFNTSRNGPGQRMYEPVDMSTFVAHYVGRYIPFRANSKILMASAKQQQSPKEGVLLGVSSSAQFADFPWKQYLGLKDTDRLVPGTKSEVYQVPLSDLLREQPYSKQVCEGERPEFKQIQGEEDQQQVVLKFAVEKPAGKRCGFTSENCRCDKRWDFPGILLHELHSSNSIHGLRADEANYAQQLFGSSFDPGRHFLNIIHFDPHLSYDVSSSDGSKTTHLKHAQANVALSVISKGASKPEELLDVIKYAYDREDYEAHHNSQEFPVAPYGVFFIRFIEQISKAMSYLHHVKNMVHFDFIERNLLVQRNFLPASDSPTRYLKEGQIPFRDGEFDAKVIDYGFVENLDIFGDIQKTHPQYPFGCTIGSGRLSPMSKLPCRYFSEPRSCGTESEAYSEAFQTLKNHDLSILCSRSIELGLVTGFRREKLKNWQGNSQTGSFVPQGTANGQAPANLGAALWPLPSKDSVVKDILVKADASHILRSKILWSFGSLKEHRLGSSQEFAKEMNALIEETSIPWLNRISSQSHPWYEKKLRDNVHGGLSVIQFILALQEMEEKAQESGQIQDLGFIETWLSGFYVDSESASKLIQLAEGQGLSRKSVYPSAIDLWRSTRVLVEKLSNRISPEQTKVGIDHISEDDLAGALGDVLEKSRLNMAAEPTRPRTNETIGGQAGLPLTKNLIFYLQRFLANTASSKEADLSINLSPMPFANRQLTQELIASFLQFLVSTNWMDHEPEEVKQVFAMPTASWNQGQEKTEKWFSDKVMVQFLDFIENSSSPLVLRDDRLSSGFQAAQQRLIRDIFFLFRTSFLVPDFEAIADSSTREKVRALIQEEDFLSRTKQHVIHHAYMDGATEQLLQSETQLFYLGGQASENALKYVNRFLTPTEVSSPLSQKPGVEASEISELRLQYAPYLKDIERSYLVARQSYLRKLFEKQRFK